MESNIDINLTGQGFGPPEPVRDASERVGSHGPLSSDRSAHMVKSQAISLDNVTELKKSSDLNPFSRCAKILRSPKLNFSGASELEIQITKTPEQESHGVTTAATPTTRDLQNDTASTVKYTKEADKLKQENMELKAHLSNIESMLSQLSEEVRTLREENKKLKTVLENKLPENKTATTTEQATELIQMEYCTDEDDLERETDWILKKRRVSKKRRANQSPETIPIDVDKSPQMIIINNDSNQISNPKLNIIKNHNPTSIKISKPPPVILSNIDEFNPIKKILEEKNIKYEIKMLNNKQLKINVETESEYRSLTKAINETKFEWHTYENKLHRPIKVMIRGLHQSCLPNDIIEELKEKNFKISDAVNMSKKVKENGKPKIVPMPLFMLIFDSNEDTKKIFEISHILHMKIKVEALKKNNQIPQCKRCQRYGHTQKFCRREAICVKCAGKHLTADCKKPNTTAPKCSNCHEAHPANYRGCLVARELQKRRKQSKSKPSQNQNQRAFDSKKVINGITYSDIVKKNTNFNQNKKMVQDQNPSKTVDSNTKQTPKIKRTSIINSKHDQNQDVVAKTMEKLVTMMDKILIRLDNLENTYTNKCTKSSRTVLKNR